MSEHPHASDRHSYQQMAELYPSQWVAFLAHGPRRYEVIDAHTDLPVLMRRVSAHSVGRRASFAHFQQPAARPAPPSEGIDL
jgi:hypothetical protein